jgi:hypothetical protein
MSKATLRLGATEKPAFRVVRVGLHQAWIGEPHLLPREGRVEEAVADLVAFAAKKFGVHGVGEAETKLSGVAGSDQPRRG